jgi:Ca2+-binding RTX toxin-like protein
MPSGAIKDIAGNNYAGTNGYDFTTAAASATAGNDTLIGTTGTDNINGLAGNDVIDGLAGNDTLRGGTGADRLTGGAGRDTFVFAPGDTGQTVGFDVITDYTKGSTSVGDLIDFSSNLTRGGNANAATATQASINQTTGIATFAAGSGTTLSDALADIATRFTAATDTAGEFAFFKVNNSGNFHMFISDGVAGVTANDVVFEMLNLTSITNINIASGNMTILG